MQITKVLKQLTLQIQSIPLIIIELMRLAGECLGLKGKLLLGAGFRVFEYSFGLPEKLSLTGSTWIEMGRVPETRVFWFNMLPPLST